MKAIALATRDQIGLLKVLIDKTPLAALVNVGRARLGDLPVPVYPDLASALEKTPAQVCCFLAPSSQLQSQVEHCLSEGIDVLSAGPPPVSQKALNALDELAATNQSRLDWGGQYRHSPVLASLRDLAQQDGFGAPVYLRHISTAQAGLVGAWWSLCQAIDLATDLLAAPLETVHLAGTRSGGHYHLSATLHSSKGAHGQLVIAPSGPPLWGDIYLLGSGGMLSSPSLSNLPTLVQGSAIKVHPPTDLYPEPQWLDQFCSGEKNQPRSPWAQPLLRGLRRLGATKGPFRVLADK